MQPEISLQVESMLAECGILWKQKGHNVNKMIDKVINLDKGGHAIILKNDCNKPIRFLYLCLLMSKKNSYNMSTLISKLNQIQQKTDQIVFLGQNEKLSNLGNDPADLYKLLLELNRRLELNKFSQTFILKTVIEYENVDYLLILVLRIIADDYKMVNALDCESAMTLGQIQILLNKFFVDKGAISNQRNKYVIFWNFDESQVKYLKEKGIIFQSQEQNFQLISDPFPIKYENCIMIEKVYSLLDEK